MTLIAYFADLGIGISDILLTIDGQGSWPYLPSVGEPGESILELPFHCSRLCRKIAKITVAGQTTPLMIAGSVSQVRSYLTAAQDLALGRREAAFNLPTQRNSIGSVLYNAAKIAEAAGQTDVRVIGMRGNETVAVSPLRRHLEYFGDVLVAGSGADEMMVFLEERSKRYSVLFASDKPEMRGFRVMHYLPMQLLYADRRSPSVTLGSGVGGFYEVSLNCRGRLEPDGVSWVRMLLQCEKDLRSGVRLRGLWWHSYEGDDLVIASAPDQDLHIPLKGSVLLPKRDIRLSRVSPYSKPGLGASTSVSTYLPRIPRARFFSLALSRYSDDGLLAWTMATRETAAVQVMWTPGGLSLCVRERNLHELVGNVQEGTAVIAQPNHTSSGRA